MVGWKGWAFTPSHTRPPSRPPFPDSFRGPLRAHCPPRVTGIRRARPGRSAVDAAARVTYLVYCARARPPLSPAAAAASSAPESGSALAGAAEEARSCGTPARGSPADCGRARVDPEPGPDRDISAPGGNGDLDSAEAENDSDSDCPGPEPLSVGGGSCDMACDA